MILFGIAKLLSPTIPSALFTSPVAEAVKYKLTNKLFHERTGDPKYGDVIFVNRYIALYRHFGIYIGKNKVIHFAAPNGDMDAEKAYIHETTLSHFSEGSDIHIMTFNEEYESGSVLRNFFKGDEYELQSPRQTVARARSMLGRKGIDNAGYNVLFNNCEDFAIWCKTNVAESKQVNELLNPFFPF